MGSQFGKLQSDSKLPSEFPFIDHGNFDNNLESPGIKLAFLPDDGVDRIAGNRASHVQRLSSHGRYVGHWPNIGKTCNRCSVDVCTTQHSNGCWVLDSNPWLSMHWSYAVLPKSALALLTVPVQLRHTFQKHSALSPTGCHHQVYRL
jgi:hypothetical protein